VHVQVKRKGIKERPEMQKQIGLYGIAPAGIADMVAQDFLFVETVWLRNWSYLRMIEDEIGIHAGDKSFKVVLDNSVHLLGVPSSFNEIFSACQKIAERIDNVQMGSRPIPLFVITPDVKGRPKETLQLSWKFCREYTVALPDKVCSRIVPVPVVQGEGTFESYMKNFNDLLSLSWKGKALKTVAVPYLVQYDEESIRDYWKRKHWPYKTVEEFWEECKNDELVKLLDDLPVLPFFERHFWAAELARNRFFLVLALAHALAERKSGDILGVHLLGLRSIGELCAYYVASVRGLLPSNLIISSCDSSLYYRAARAVALLDNVQFTEVEKSEKMIDYLWGQETLPRMRIRDVLIPEDTAEELDILRGYYLEAMSLARRFEVFLNFS